MIRSRKHARHLFAIGLILTPSIVSCTTLNHRSFDSGTRLQDVSGVTTRSGSEVSFAETSASIKNDTLYALGEKGPLKMPTDSIARVSTRKFSAWRTIALAGGIGVVALVAFALADIKSNTIP